MMRWFLAAVPIETVSRRRTMRSSTIFLSRKRPTRRTLGPEGFIGTACISIVMAPDARSLPRSLRLHH